MGALFVRRINGCFYNVMGLPLSAIYDALRNEFDKHKFKTMIEKPDAGLLESIRTKQAPKRNLRADRRRAGGARHQARRRHEGRAHAFKKPAAQVRLAARDQRHAGGKAGRREQGADGGESIALKAAFELGRRALDPQARNIKVSSPKDAADMMRPRMINLMQEHFKTILLDTKNYVISVEDITVGTINSSLVHAREVFRGAIVKNAYSIILVHNIRARILSRA
jgi:hypothetical protein